MLAKAVAGVVCNSSLSQYGRRWFPAKARSAGESPLSVRLLYSSSVVTNHNIIWPLCFTSSLSFSRSKLLRASRVATGLTNVGFPRVTLLTPRLWSQVSVGRSRGIKAHVDGQLQQHLDLRRFPVLFVSCGTFKWLRRQKSDFKLLLTKCQLPAR